MTALELSVKYKTLLNRNGINTPLRLAHFFAQIDHESNLKPQRENMNYSAKRLREIFPKYFTLDQAKSYANNPEKIGSRVYANRMGNGPESTGDGYRYRGGGFLQHTGLNEMKILKDRTGVDFVKNPNLLSEEVNAMVAALDYWNRSSLSKLADSDNLDAISDLINIGRLTPKYGDSNGFLDRKNKLSKYKSIFGAKS